MHTRTRAHTRVFMKDTLGIMLENQSNKQDFSWWNGFDLMLGRSELFDKLETE